MPDHVNGHELEFLGDMFYCLNCEIYYSTKADAEGVRCGRSSEGILPDWKVFDVLTGWIP